MNKRLYDIAIASFSGFLIFLTILTILFIPTLNPLPQSHNIPLGLNYPDLPNNSPFKNESVVGLQIFIELHYIGELSVNNKITLGESTCQINSLNYSNIKQVRVGFTQALPWSFKKIEENLFSYTVTNWGTSFIYLNDTNSLYHGTKSDLYFPISGDYSPTITIQFDNDTAPINYTYENVRIPVIAESDLAMLNMNRISVALTIALLVFSFIEGFTIIGKLWEKRKNAQSDTTDNIPPANMNTKQIFNDNRRTSQNNAETTKNEKIK